MPTKTTKKVTNKKVVDKKEEVKAVKPARRGVARKNSFIHKI